MKMAEEGEIQSVQNVEKFILRELIKRRKIGGAHTPLDRVTRSLPDEILQQKHSSKITERAIKELVNAGMVIVLQKRTGKDSDLHISINPRAWKEIGLFLGLAPGEIP